jgi:hypothetical protein
LRRGIAARLGQGHRKNPALPGRCHRAASADFSLRGTPSPKYLFQLDREQDQRASRDDVQPGFEVKMIGTDKQSLTLADLYLPWLSTLPKMGGYARFSFLLEITS